MIKRDEVLDTLRGSGMRLTTQRLIILSIVAHSDAHLGVDEVYRRVRESCPFMDVATVYRNLHLLKGLGLVTEVAIGDCLYYELTDPEYRHHHMAWWECGGALNLYPDHLNEFRRTLVKEFSFESDLNYFTITGIYTQCQPKVQK